jgi:hypothetical protein
VSGHATLSPTKVAIRQTHEMRIRHSDCDDLASRSTHCCSRGKWPRPELYWRDVPYFMRSPAAVIVSREISRSWISHGKPRTPENADIIEKWCDANNVVAFLARTGTSICSSRSSRIPSFEICRFSCIGGNLYAFGTTFFKLNPSLEHSTVMGSGSYKIIQTFETKRYPCVFRFKLNLTYPH